MSKVRVCFLGTPEFAVESLKRVFSDEHYEIVGVITQPDRPSGRKLLLQPSPVKAFAMAHGLRVISPESVNKIVIRDEVQSWGAELAIVVAFGQILGDKFLNLFPLGCVNVHGSILPRWRGAAPIQRSLEFGDQVTGVALQKMVKELDAGDVIGERKVQLDENINAQELHDRLAILGGDLLHVELMDYVRGNLVPVPQDPSGITYAKKIDKAEALIEWSQSAKQIHNKVRAFVMGPGTYTILNGKKIKIHKTQISNLSSESPAGSVVEVSTSELFVQTGDGVLQILELQPESRNRMIVSEFLKGHPLQKGDLLGR